MPVLDLDPELVTELLELTEQTADVRRRVRTGTDIEGHPIVSWTTIRPGAPILFSPQRGGEDISIRPDVTVLFYDIFMEAQDVTEQDRLLIQGKEHGILSADNMFDMYMFVRTQIVR